MALFAKVKRKFVQIWIFSVLLTFFIAFYLYFEIDFFDPIKRVQNHSYLPFATIDYSVSDNHGRDDNASKLQWNSASKVDIQMLDLYETLKFDNAHGGAWTQGWDIHYSENQWTSAEKLKVFIVPHSHNDPGWLKTVEQYYADQTRRILDLILEYLTNDPQKTFIWAEISYFSMWWNDIEQDKKDAVKRLLLRNQLEIVTGGWVMNDEANTHWFSMLEQLTVGNQWLKRNLNYTAKSSWSIDPFGQSATFPLILKLAGFENLLIQRVHYSVKKHFARMKQLEFNWRQISDVHGNTDLFTQLMPFYSYDIPHTCGPDPKVCCQFDFRRLRYLSCPWNVHPVEIDDNNIAERAYTLLDQYRKKATLFRTNSLLVPLGDDFRYDVHFEWDKQFDNYKLLIDYINKMKNFNAEIKFATLSDYFDSVKRERSPAKFPVLSGDFFTYADKGDEFWSGYYTSRPFYKRMDRVLLAHIRSAEILLTLAEIQRPELNFKHFENLLEECRMNHALFQHHDGITGTAKTLVVDDYATKMLNSIEASHKILQFSAHSLLSESEPDISQVYYDSNTQYSSTVDQAKKPVILVDQIGKDKSITFFNSLLFDRHELVKILVANPFIQVLDEKNDKVSIQISPFFNDLNEIEPSIYEIAFYIKIKPLSLIRYKLSALSHRNYNEISHSVSEIIFYKKVLKNKSTFFQNIQYFSRNEEFSLENEFLKASFKSNGLLKSIRIGDQLIYTHLEFIKYGVYKNRDIVSGAYLFIPDKEASVINISRPKVYVIKGPLYSSVNVNISLGSHCLSIEKYQKSISIENTIDITSKIDIELAMRLDTSIKSDDIFYTDLNGFQYLKRKRFHKLPIQGNYYPLPTLGWIEDAEMRLSIATSSPLGSSSQKSGSFEIMQDRRLSRDDNRGLAQGVLDNVPVRHQFRVLLEHKLCDHTGDSSLPNGNPSQEAYRSSNILINPLIEMISKNSVSSTERNTFYGSLDVSNRQNLVLVTLRTRIYFNNSSDNFGLVLTRQYFDECFADKLTNDFKKIDLNNLIVGLSNMKKVQSSLSFSNPVTDNTIINNSLDLNPMDIKAIVLFN